jgi:hypothetical protein
VRVPATVAPRDARHASAVMTGLTAAAGTSPAFRGQAASWLSSSGPSPLLAEGMYPSAIAQVRQPTGSRSLPMLSLVPAPGRC